MKELLWSLWECKIFDWQASHRVCGHGQPGSQKPFINTKIIRIFFYSSRIQWVSLMDGAVCPFDSQLSNVKVWSYLYFLFSAFVISQVCLLPVSPNVSQRQMSPFLNKAVLGYYARGKIQQCQPQEPCLLYLKWGERSTEKGRAHKPDHCKYSPLTNFQGLPWDLVCSPCMCCWWVQSFLETFLKGSSSFLPA